jgi:hypothetical protein
LGVDSPFWFLVSGLFCRDLGGSPSPRELKTFEVIAITIAQPIAFIWSERYVVVDVVRPAEYFDRDDAIVGQSAGHRRPG